MSAPARGWWKEGGSMSRGPELSEDNQHLSRNKKKNCWHEKCKNARQKSQEMRLESQTKDRSYTDFVTYFKGNDKTKTKVEQKTQKSSMSD